MMGLYFFNNPIIQLVTQSYTCHKKNKLCVALQTT